LLIVAAIIAVLAVVFMKMKSSAPKAAPVQTTQSANDDGC
jgi:hypothetical protein